MSEIINQPIFDLKEFLSNTQMFQGLPVDQLEAITKITQTNTYKKGEVIFWEGDEGNGFFIVKAGRVKVFKVSGDGKEQILHLFKVGDHFAEVPAFDGKSFPASAAAVAQAEIIFFPRTSFLELLQQQPTIAINMLASFARHLRRFNHLVDSLSLKEVPERLAAYLLNLSEVHGNAETVELDVTKSQLAAVLGTIPATLSRVFYKLSSEGLIAIDGASIRLVDRDRLSRLMSK